jgi:hypothetical protein
MRVSARNFVALFALVLGLALAIPTFAKGHSTTFSLTDSIKVAGNTLPAGDYQVVVSDSTATFKHNGKVVAEAKGEWKKLTSRETQDAIVRDADGRVLEIHLEGRDSCFVIS